MAVTEAPGPPEGIRIRNLGLGDIHAALALSKEAGWNQTAEDWVWMITRGQGWACVDADDRVVATALIQPQSVNFGWISMVLVTETWRRRGIASFLMSRSIEALRAIDRVPGLDATPAGRAVYGPLGFRDIYGLTRFRADLAPRREALPGTDCRPITAADWPALAMLDRAVFGADRLGLLKDLFNRAPALAWVAEAGDGFCLGRNGRGSLQLGPLVADDPNTAISLLEAACGALEGPVMIDVPDHHTEVVTWLKDTGFQAERPYMRMLLDRDGPFDDPGRVFAIAGPELG